MKICYIGNYKQKHCTEVHIAATLEDLGHEVYRVQEDNPPENWFQNSLGCDLILFTRTWGNLVTNEHIAEWCERNIPSASYHLDLYVGLSRKYLHQGKSLDEVLQTDPFWRTDYVFTPDGDPESAKVFERNGVSHYYMRPGVFRAECYTAPHTGGNDGHPTYERLYKHQVLFVGGGDYLGSPNGYGHPEWTYRDRLVQWLRETYGDRFAKFGHPQPTVRNEELNQLYADSKVVVGDSVCIPDFKHTYYWSDRVYETLGRGGFLIHPYIKGMEEEFVDGEHLVFYEFGNWDQLKQKIDYYLEHDDERERIRRAGHEFVKNNSTYHNRLTGVLSVIAMEEGDGKFSRAYYYDRKPVDSNGAPVAVDTPSAEGPLRINLGAGSEPTDGWVNVDWVKGEGIQVEHNLLLFPWPFEDSSAEEMKAIDVLEHMPNYTPDNKATVLEFIEECHRILKPGGRLTIQVPHWASPNMWKDPTHVRGFDPESLDYFDPDTNFGKWYGYYTRGKFHVSSELSQMPDGQPSNITFTLVKR